MHITCVCTGNTCRSPMAAALLRQWLNEHGLDFVQVDSAGLAADGDAVADNAVDALAAVGLAPLRAYSKPLTRELFDATDLFLVMSPAHKQYLLAAGADEAAVVVLGGGIPDPFGCGADVYAATRDRLQQAVADWGEAQFPLAIRPLCERHLPSLAALEQVCFSQPWSEDALREELSNPTARFLVAEKDGEAVGYIGCHFAADEGAITNVAVSPNYRRQGVGGLLLDALLYAAEKEHIGSIFLEVRVSNTAAKALYQSRGFVSCGLRPRFYTAPTEDGEIFSWTAKG